MIVDRGPLKLGLQRRSTCIWHFPLLPPPLPPGPQLRPCLNVKYLPFLTKFDKLSKKLILKAEPMHHWTPLFPSFMISSVYKSYTKTISGLYVEYSVEYHSALNFNARDYEATSRVTSQGDGRLN